MRLFLDSIIYKDRLLQLDLSPQEDNGYGFMQFFYSSDLTRSELDQAGLNVTEYQSYAESFEDQMKPLVRYLQRHSTLVGFNIMNTCNVLTKLFQDQKEFEFDIKLYNLIDLRVFFETYCLDKKNLRKLFGVNADSVLDDRGIMDRIAFDLEITDSDSDIQTKTLGDGHTIPGRFFDVVKQKEGGVKIYYRFGKLKGQTVNKSDEHLSYMRWWIKQEGCTSAEKTFIKALMKKV